MSNQSKYREIYSFLKRKIQKGDYQVGEYLPSENDLCKQFSITRTTARKGLDELVKEGYINRRQGKGSCVMERRKSLGLLNVKGFSEAAGENIKTVFLQKPKIGKWDSEIMNTISEIDQHTSCIYFERIRYVGSVPVVLEKNWFSGEALPGFLDSDFIGNSFFKTLSEKYSIEVIGSSQELRAEKASEKKSQLLNISLGSPLLHISIMFFTSDSKLTIYAELDCLTTTYPVGNSFFV